MLNKIYYLIHKEVNMKKTVNVETLNRNSSTLSPHEKFIVAIIKSGLKEKDMKYINSETFEYHCNLIGLDEYIVKNGALNMLEECSKTGKCSEQRRRLVFGKL